MTLTDIQEHESCIIVKVHGHGGFRHRIMELGFVKGERVTVLKNAPLQDPVEYEVMGSHVSMRRSEAQNIEVVSLAEGAHPDNIFHGTIEEHVAHEVDELSKQITVALVGNPNCGKTSFFNFATGLREKVGNYSGVTVDSKVGTFLHRGYTINLVDLPGTYSLTEYTPEELYVRDFLIREKPDIVLNIVDAGNLERNLFLTTQLIDQNPRMVMALNMYDELQKSGNILDHESLSRMLGFPIVPVIAKNNVGISDVLEQIVQVYEDHGSHCKHIHVNYGENVEKAIANVKRLLDEDSSIRAEYHSRYIALKLIENDSVTKKSMTHLTNYDKVIETANLHRQELEAEYHDDIASIISNIKYGFIRGALSETLTQTTPDNKRLAFALDTILTNRWLGFPVLLFFLWVMFQTTFSLGEYPQMWIEAGVDWLRNYVVTHMTRGPLTDLIADGIIAGVGGVLSFLPNIVILFLFISILEDTGYMARAAFIMDKIMHRIGLHGKSFIPFLIGFGCSVPAIMATRTLENRKDRILTTLAIPFFSCSARLPVYLLFVSAFFPSNQGLVLMSIYLIGILTASLTALLFKKTLFNNNSDQFVMELPPYRIPTLRNMFLHMWDKSAQYLKKMGSVILLASIIVWALGYFPHNIQAEQIAIQAAELSLQGADNEQIETLLLQQKALQNEHSYIGQLGHLIEPIVKPLGFDWRMGVSILTGLGAKEIVVSTMGILYQANSNANEDSSVLIHALRSSTDANGLPILSPLVAFVFMIFVLLYFPCVAAISAIGREIGWKWAIFTIIYSTSLAWVISWIIYQIGSLL